MPSAKRVKLPSWGGNTNAWQQEADLFRAMDESAIRQAATQAGQVIKTACQDLVFSQADLEDYGAVGERTTVWSDEENVHVGIPEGDPLKERADEMNEEVFPVIETAFDMVRREAIEAFEFELRFA